MADLLPTLAKAFSWGAGKFTNYDGSFAPTGLSGANEIAYQVTKAGTRFAKNDDASEYNLRGFYQQNGNLYGNLDIKSMNFQGGHLNDLWKTPMHPTFSTESYYNVGQKYAVQWGNTNRPQYGLSNNWNPLTEQASYKPKVSESLLKLNSGGYSIFQPVI